MNAAMNVADSLAWLQENTQARTDAIALELKGTALVDITVPLPSTVCRGRGSFDIVTALGKIRLFHPEVFATDGNGIVVAKLLDELSALLHFPSANQARTWFDAYRKHLSAAEPPGAGLSTLTIVNFAFI